MIGRFLILQDFLVKAPKRMRLWGVTFRSFGAITVLALGMLQVDQDPLILVLA